MIDLLKQIDFKKDISEDSELNVFLREAAKSVANDQIDTLRKIKKPQSDQELQNHFIVYGIPVLKNDNRQKFMELYRKKILDAKKIGEVNGLLDIQIGLKNQIGNQTLYMIYKTVAQAKAALKKLHNFKFDKNHTFQCFTVKEILEVMNFQPKYHEPTLIPHQQKIIDNIEQEHLNQFIVRQGNEVMLRWLDHLDKSSSSVLENQYIRNDNNKVLKVSFSPKGSYMAICVNNGTFLYGGKDMKLKGFYPQIAPIDVKFSLNETYMLTYNGVEVKSKQNFIIWAVQEQIKLKSWRSTFNQTIDSFQFNENSSALAIAFQSQIIFYNIATIQQFRDQLKLSDQELNCFKTSHAQKISWLKDNKSIICLCYDLDYNPNSPAVTRVFIYDFKNKIERKWRAWSQHAKKGEIIVSEKGEWVAVVMKKFIKKNHFASVIQIGNLIKKEDPIQISTIQIKEQIGNVSWDSRNNRFSLIHQDQTTKHGINVRYTLEFYQIATKNRTQNIIKIHQIKNILSNRVVLSSNGLFFAVYNLSEESPQRGKISFGLINSKDSSSKKTQIQWIKQNIMIHQLSYFKIDESGRFVLLGTQKTYQVWSMVGQMITKDTLQKDIHDLQWRPRFMTLLDQAAQSKLRQQEKDIKKKFQELDLKKLDFLKYQKEQAKKKRKIQFTQYLTKKRQWANGYAQTRKKILGFDQFLVRSAVFQVETIEPL